MPPCSPSPSGPPSSTGSTGAPAGRVDLSCPPAARTPRTLWIELTSKCPFDCVFCSRQMRRGHGSHLPFDVYTTLIDSLIAPRRLVLNYSGESTLYPHLLAAIQKARAAGAFVELVSVLAAAPESLLEPLSRSGLNRLTVSLHTTDPLQFGEIYRHGSFHTLHARLQRLVALCRTAADPPSVDLAFVAMETNLKQLPAVAELAECLGLAALTVFPVLRRDEIPAEFPVEIGASGSPRPQFAARLRSTVEEAAQGHPGIRFQVSGDLGASGPGPLGEVPVAYPWDLPAGALVYSCEQNPWETTHVLSNGDVVACEVLDKQPLGNLQQQSLREIWGGEAYRQFRKRYREGEVLECRSCPWKRAYRPGPLAPEILASRGASAQLLHGWHEPVHGEPHIWSGSEAAAALAPRPRSETLHVHGILPPGADGQPNRLTVLLNGIELGNVTNPSEENLRFGLDFAVDGNQHEPWVVEFRTTHTYRAFERGGTDQRDLGFALVMVASQPYVNSERAAIRKSSLEPVRNFIRRIDHWGALAARAGRRPLPIRDCDWKPGLSLIIPEWDNAAELAECLHSVRTSAARCEEPVETVVVVNGSPAGAYEALRREYRGICWRFHDRPLGFAGAIQDGLKVVKYDWVYLLNSDVVLDPLALPALARERSPSTFSLASQIVLKDVTRYRDETNWTTLFVEGGLAVIHDRIPTVSIPVPAFYAGGGSSLFRTRLLGQFIDRSAYHPFYWEDVEWGWRARKLGYESRFCPASIAHHTRRSTISKHYPPDHIEMVVRRNALLFQLRNFITAGSIERVYEEIARADYPLREHFLAAGARWRIARARWWNHLAPLSDEQVFERWNSSISTC